MHLATRWKTVTNVATTASLLALLPAAAQAARTASAPQVAPEAQTVSLLAAHAVRSAPGTDSRTVAAVAAKRPVTGARTTLPVLAQTIDDDGRFWLQVRLPGRVLGGRTPPRSGWISAERTRLATTRWHIVVEVRARRVAVYRGGRVLRSYTAGVGKPSTPTPLGEFFVEENVKMPSDALGAPFALALSARSAVLREFAGGPGQIAVHGMRNIGGRLGTGGSFGCVRLGDRDIEWLAHHIMPGVPVTILG